MSLRVMLIEKSPTLSVTRSTIKFVCLLVSFVLLFLRFISNSSLRRVLTLYVFIALFFSSLLFLTLPKSISIITYSALLSFTGVCTVRSMHVGIYTTRSCFVQYGLTFWARVCMPFFVSPVRLAYAYTSFWIRYSKGPTHTGFRINLVWFFFFYCFQPKN